jgi:hypothetical protein
MGAISETTKPALVPTPKEIDALAKEYKLAEVAVAERKAELKAATDTQDEIKGRVVEMVKAFGGRHAEKSLRLLGIHSVATVTTATVVKTDPEKVEKFRGYLGEQEIKGLSERFFRSHTIYSLVDGPAEVLKTLDVPTRIRTKITQLLSLCFTVETKAPSLKVELVEAEKPARAGRAS